VALCRTEKKRENIYDVIDSQGQYNNLIKRKEETHASKDEREPK
jgi:hypothetical protein